MQNPFLPIETDQTTETPDVGETAHHFTCRSRREEMIEVRQVLFNLFESFPDSDRKRTLVAEIVKSEDALVSPVTELITARIFKVLGFEVTPEPRTEGIASQPDLRVTHPDGHDYMVEVFTTLRDSRGNLTNRKVLEDALTVMFRKVKSTDFFVGVEIIRAGQQAPSASRLGTALQTFLDGLDYEEVLAFNIAERFNAHYIDIEDNGWVVRFEANCKRSSRGKTDACRGSGPSSSHWGNSGDALRATLVKKRDQHKAHSLPFIYVANVALWHADLGDLSAALNGTPACNVTTYDDLTTEHKWIRKPDAFWFNNTGSKNQHVHAVLGLSRLGPDCPGHANTRVHFADECPESLKQIFCSFPSEFYRGCELVTDTVQRLDQVLPRLLEFD